MRVIMPLVAIRSTNQKYLSIYCEKPYWITEKIGIKIFYFMWNYIKIKE